MAKDSDYLTPYEASLAIVATSMKKARLRIDTLILNSLLGGTLFASGSFLYMAINSTDPELYKTNPGILEFIGGVCYGFALYFVVITGADLFNSNVLYCTVGLLRRAITIFDCIIIVSVSWISNIGASLFNAYLFGYLSGIGRKENWVIGTKLLVESKDSYTFIQTFLKGIAGNFFVCLGIYLQLMAKPIHVKLFVLIIPIFVISAVGFTHAVADMVVLYLGMMNGANLSVGKYIWRLLIPATLGNLLGGFVFGLVVPFYLQLIVVERDREKLSLPEYFARDEQPELNVDSRVVRVPINRETMHESSEAEEESESETETEVEIESESTTANSDHTFNDLVNSTGKNIYENIYQNENGIESRSATLSVNESEARFSEEPNRERVKPDEEERGREGEGEEEEEEEGEGEGEGEGGGDREVYSPRPFVKPDVENVIATLPTRREHRTYLSSVRSSYDSSTNGSRRSFESTEHERSISSRRNTPSIASNDTLRSKYKPNTPKEVPTDYFSMRPNELSFISHPPLPAEEGFSYEEELRKMKSQSVATPPERLAATASTTASAKKRTAKNAKSKSRFEASVIRGFGNLRSPPGVFPVYGMAPPLMREKTIENPNLNAYEKKFKLRTRKMVDNRKPTIHVTESIGQASYSRNKRSLHHETSANSLEQILRRKPHSRNNPNEQDLKSNQNKSSDKEEKNYNVLRDSTGAKLERALSTLSYRSGRRKDDIEEGPSRRLAKKKDGTQIPFEHNSPESSGTY
ncbi:hypothetical protein TBLA_0I01520 [Henningerozyma blattae CBS 6284]|uniref:Formate/nitrite transporter n=1 Tax=Henningerozyma blattae (strain ATCC 34711 / CBS 6284 / DSM 70876 / NBRC 10599 / NRRL Y-10934 / UCD 77-7) TaxID=1071380 RepID=I2H8V9_HENB6|nr:hypothetical protein TBLA_0I01520 [Tetrapisispora blattae CBS 6284]CCH62811.1 hypothetical protein TBLA_0I01520 [Tetrapisispora blattae CBS 6284]